MYYHCLVVSYKGTKYFGWQDLGTKEQKPTVEATIYKVLKKICKYQSCTISSASRTDAGVHAQGQVIKITIDLLIDSHKLLLGMNSLLPDDIRIIECNPSTLEFNSNKDCKSKEYHYYFCSDLISNPILNDLVMNVPLNNYGSNIELDIELMQEACKLFVGEHDFYSFSKRDANINSTFRTIYSCEILQSPSLTMGNKIYYLKIIGKGFLSYMVRYISGALFELGKNKITLSDIREALSIHKEHKISSKAKSCGLHLINITY
ncbi:MAG: tRNA pseudouridine(38-40) synthase TruA [Arcobacteraceae bacterium]